MKVNETRRRSLLKASSFRVLEIALDSLILSIFLSPPVAIGVAVLLEVLCFVLHFSFERVWNRIEYGRQIIND